MTFDPFRDFETRGYLRNFEGCKDIAIVKANENIAFQTNVAVAMNALVDIKFVEYKHVLATHKTLFGDVYPWAGEDRLKTSPNISISKAGYERMFADPTGIRLAMDYALNQGQDLTFMRDKPGEVMGSLAHAHPFLDGNGRTIMTIHTELAHRAGIEIDWVKTDKTAYLTALTREVYAPGKGHLDEYLKPFIREAGERIASVSMLKSLKGLGTPAIPAVAPPTKSAKSLTKVTLADLTDSQGEDDLISAEKRPQTGSLADLNNLKDDDNQTEKCLTAGTLADLNISDESNTESGEVDDDLGDLNRQSL
jgi:cell filamentation protein